MAHQHIFSYQLSEHPGGRPRRALIVAAALAGVLAVLLTVMLLGALTESGGAKTPSPAVSPTSVTGAVQEAPSFPAPASATP
jgi:hypothetical protein